MRRRVSHPSGPVAYDDLVRPVHSRRTVVHQYSERLHFCNAMFLGVRGAITRSVGTWPLSRRTKERMWSRCQCRWPRWTSMRYTRTRYMCCRQTRQRRTRRKRWTRQLPRRILIVTSGQIVDPLGAFERGVHERTFMMCNPPFRFCWSPLFTIRLGVPRRAVQTRRSPDA